ncbi:MAG TPA: 50S ribosomal protein L10 [Thermoleophilaceae bacterium]|nr:50S ribosomal protein L10 [Thermoleophilaceae bacterium]
MNRDQKAAVVAEVATQIQESEAVFAVDYRGISVPQAADLRVKLNDAGARFRVVKNTLTELAADRAGADPLKEVLDGPTAFTFVASDGGDVALAAKALAQFRRETNLLEFKGGVMGGEALSAEQIGEIARLPAKDVLYGQVVGMIASPITGLVRGLNALISGLAIQLKQIADEGMVPVAGAAGAAASGGEEPAPAEAASGDEDSAPAEASDSESGDGSASGTGESAPAEASTPEAEAGGGSASGDEDGESAADSASGNEESAPAEASEAESNEESAADSASAEADQAAQADQAEEEAAQSAQGEETESSSEESAPAGDAAAGDEAAAAPGDESAGAENNQSETPSEGDEQE